MKISSKSRYAVSAMIDLALHENGSALTIADIAKKQNISLSYLEQIFADLRKGGLVKGTRGPGGGYRLAIPSTTITISQVIDALGEKGAAYDLQAGGYQPFAVWSKLSDRVFNYLKDITLKECIEEAQAATTTAETASVVAKQVEEPAF